MTSQRSVVFAEPVRTAIGTFGGSLKDVSAPTLGSKAIAAAVTLRTFAPMRWKRLSWGTSSRLAPR